MSVNSPPTALMVSTRSPLPLSPRLTPASSSHQQRSEAEERDRSRVASSSGSRNTATTLIAHQTTRRRARSRPLLHRTGQPTSTPTQALSRDTTPSTHRFAAYLPTAARSRIHSATGSQTLDPGGTFESISWPIFSNAAPVEGPHDTVQKQPVDLRSAPAEFTFEVMSQFRSNSQFRGDTLVRCGGHSFYVHKA